MHENDANNSELTKDTNTDKPNLKGDWLNFFLLLLLYLMQGMSLGLSYVIPIIFQSKKNVSYKEQALFSIVGLPSAIKIIWAPLVDAFYVQKIGRRKSWLIPVQCLIGACYLYLANNIDELLPETGKPNIIKLVLIFFIVHMLAATQDIVVDGWALTMLKKNNVGYASTCNTTGHITGLTIGSLLFVLFTSEDFCNKYFRIIPSTGGIITMKSLLYVLAIFFILITILIAIFKKEKDNRFEDDYLKISIIQNYSLLWDILKLPSIRILAITMLTSEVGFAATRNISILKLIDLGVPKDNIMIIRTMLLAMITIIPLIVGKYTSGPRSISIYINMTPIRLLWNIPFIALIYYTPKLINNNGIIDIPLYYYAILVFIFSMHDIICCTIFVAKVAYFSRISDSRFGGTYMTLLDTFSNVGREWPYSVAVGIIDFLTVNECSFDDMNNCSTKNRQNACAAKGGECITTISGYYVEITVCTFIGIIWFGVFRIILKNFQTRSASHWTVNVKNKIKNNDYNEQHTLVSTTAKP